MAPRMIFIYGPPAVGKLTVARLVAERTGFKLLHNHLTIDAVAPILGFGTPAFNRFLQTFRRDLIAAAAEAGVDLVCTLVLAVGEEPLVDELVAPYEGRIMFVQLLASREELRRRVAAEHRAAHGKIVDAETLDAVLNEFECFEAIAGRDSVTLDTEAMSPEETADRIVALAGDD